LRASSLERLPDGALGRKADKAHASGPDALRAYVREMAKAGIDSIKFLLSSDDAFTPGGSQKLTYSEQKSRRSVTKHGSAASTSPATRRLPRR